MTDSFTTGVQALDRELDGGIPPGTLVAFLAAPASQAELFLSVLASRAETLYLTTERSPTDVTRSLNEHHGAVDDVAVKAVDGDAPVVESLEYVRTLPEGGLVVVDPVDPLERTDEGGFRAFLESLRARLTQADAIGVLHALKRPTEPPRRDRTMYMADLVFDLVTEPVEDRLETRLLVPKFRGGSALTDAVRLELTDRIVVDNSRDIA